MLFRRTTDFVLLLVVLSSAFAVSSPVWAQAPADTAVMRSWPPEINECYIFYYNLLPADTVDLFEDEIPLLWSETEKQNARDIAARMEAAFNDWIAQYPELTEERHMDRWWLQNMQDNHLEVNLQYAYFAPHEHAGVLRKVFVYLYKDDPELANELQQALALPDVPQPEVDRPGDPRNKPEWQDYIDTRVGYRIEWKMFSVEKIHHCIDQGRTPDVFSAEEQTAARKVLGKIRDDWHEWMAAHPEIVDLECNGFSTHHAQTQHLAGVPTSFWVLLGVEDEDLLVDVLATLDIPGAPEPEVTNVREEREAANKRRDGISD